MWCTRTPCAARTWERTRRSSISSPTLSCARRTTTHCQLAVWLLAYLNVRVVLCIGRAVGPRQRATFHAIPKSKRRTPTQAWPSRCRCVIVELQARYAKEVVSHVLVVCVHCCVRFLGGARRRVGNGGREGGRGRDSCQRGEWLTCTQGRGWGGGVARDGLTSTALMELCTCYRLYMLQASLYMCSYVFFLGKRVHLWTPTYICKCHCGPYPH
jgi:hypothetical protein